MLIDNHDLDKLPWELSERAIVLAQEPAWRPDDAIAVVNFLADHDCDIEVVEAWQDGAAAPYFYDTCCFYPDGGRNRASKPWKEEVEHSRSKAIEFIEGTRHKMKLIYNLHWNSITDVE